LYDIKIFDIKIFYYLFCSLDGMLCKSVLDSLKHWEFEVNPTSEDDISPQGRMDMQLMAKRTKDKLSEVLVKEINQNTFKVNTLS